jgi:hypothetical protein
MDTTRIYMEYLWSKEAKKNVQLEFNFTCNFCHCDGHSSMCIYYVPNVGTVPRNRFRSHHPHDDSGDGGFYFDSADELLNHNFIKGFSCHDGFFRYAVSTDNALMAEYKNGKEWWPIGRVKDTSYLGLPNWEPKK